MAEARAQIDRQPDPAALCRWVAETLLGWKRIELGGGNFYWDADPSVEEAPTIDAQELQSWHGIGLVIAEMERRASHGGEAGYELVRFDHVLCEGLGNITHWWHLPIPKMCHHVFHAAQRAVEGK